MRAPVSLVVAALLLVAGCGAPSSDGTTPSSPASSVGTAVATTAAPVTTGSDAQRQQALASVPEALAHVEADQRAAACASFNAGPDAFLAAFEERFDVVYTPITEAELATVRSTLEQVCGS